MPRRGFTLTEVAFVVVIIIIIISLLTPFMKDIRNKARVLACEENLERLGLGLKLYASEHQGKFPPDLGELTEDGYVESATNSDYHYVTGYTALSPSHTTLVFDKAEKHKEGKHVLYVSGDIEWEENGAMAE